jgi:acyl carrier protein
MDNIETKVITITAEQLGVPVSELTLDKQFIGDLGADSLDMVELVMAMEDEFSIEIEDKEAEELTTIEKACKFIREKSKA